MSAITRKLTEAKKGGGGFIPFVTAGDPDIDTSLSICLKLAELGADVIELGVPFSDPMADGPTIQRSSQRALNSGVILETVIEIARQFRHRSDVPLVLFSYFNPIMSFGIDNFIDAAAGTGVDGLLLTDVIDDEAAELSVRLARKKIDLISLIAPTTTDHRLEKICQNAKGFVYAVSRSGVTGVRSEIAVGARKLVQRARQFTDLPIAVGFGISTRQQIEDVWNYADAAVIGSAIVAETENAEKPGDAIERVERLVTELLPQFAKTGGDT